MNLNFENFEKNYILLFIKTVKLMNLMILEDELMLRAFETKYRCLFCEIIITCYLSNFSTLFIFVFKSAIDV